LTKNRYFVTSQRKTDVWKNDPDIYLKKRKKIDKIGFDEIDEKKKKKGFLCLIQFLKNNLKFSKSSDIDIGY